VQASIAVGRFLLGGVAWRRAPLRISSLVTALLGLGSAWRSLSPGIYLSEYCSGRSGVLDGGAGKIVEWVARAQVASLVLWGSSLHGILKYSVGNYVHRRLSVGSRYF
jgi:hypothetical protein